MADNTIASAQIKVEAETSKAEQAIKDLRSKMDELGKSIDDLSVKQKAAGDAGAEFGKVTTSLRDVKASLRDVSDLLSILAKLEAPIRIARDFFQLGREIEAVGEKLLGIPDVVGQAMSALESEGKSPASIVRQQVKDLQKEWLDGGLLEEWKRTGKVIQDAIFGWSTEAEYDARFNKSLELLKKSLNRLSQAEQEEAAKLQVRKLEAARQSAEERINLEYQIEAEANVKKYGKFAGTVNEALRAKKAAEIDAAREVEAKRLEMEDRRRQRELDEIAERRDAYMNLIRKQELATIESNERIAKQTEAAMSRALSSIAQQYDSMLGINKMAMTLEAINANMKVLVSKRSGI